ncbi:MAG: response regulator transcription factor [Christensenellaceae bacterium]|jgi:two-component system response regulator ArlR
MKLLLVEDERQLSEILTTLLKQKEYEVDAVFDGIAGEEYAKTGVYDVIILDVMLPGQDGLSLLRALRKAGIATPVLLLTAKSEIEDKIIGLEQGADDYLTKPFSTGELVAQIRALTRRKGEYIGDELTFQNTILNRDTHVLRHRGNTVKLSAKEYQILELLMQNSTQIIPKERFIEKIWGFDTEAEYNAIEVYISFIRKKLGAIEADMQVRAARGVGYFLEAAND